MRVLRNEKIVVGKIVYTYHMLLWFILLVIFSHLRQGSSLPLWFTCKCLCKKKYASDQKKFLQEIRIPADVHQPTASPLVPKENEKKKNKTLSDALNICKSSSPETAKPVWQQNKQQIGFTRGQCDAFSRLCRLVHCQWSQFSSAPVYCKQTRRRFCQDEGWLTSRRLGAVKHSLWGTCLESGQAQVGVECFRHRKLSMFSVAVLPLNKVVRLLPGSDDCCFTKSVHLAPNGANKAVSVAQIV